MRVDIWSDIVCPWCYIGKRHFEQGLAGFGHRDEIEVVYHAFELDPSIPPGPGTPILELLAAKYGMSQEQAAQAEAAVAAAGGRRGLPFTGSRVMGNTFDAHRLVAPGPRARRAGPRCCRACTRRTSARASRSSSPAELTGLAAAAGLDPAEAAQVLADGSYADAVREDEAQAGALGISGVPFTVPGRQVRGLRRPAGRGVRGGAGPGLEREPQRA